MHDLRDRYSVKDCKEVIEVEGNEIRGLTYQCYRGSGKFPCVFRFTIKPPCTCKQCAQQFRGEEQKTKTYTYAFALTDAEASQQAQSYRQDIFESLEYLKYQCNTYGDTILKRWKKKGFKKREFLLLQVDPDLYPKQWCDIQFSREYSQVQKGEKAAHEADTTPGLMRRQYRNACLLPYLNIEELRDDALKVLSLLYNRTKYSPEQFAPYDNSLLCRQWELGALELSYNENSIIMSGDRYGCISPWDADSAHKWTAIGYPRAILIFEAQAKLMRFLRRFVELLLPDHETILLPSQASLFLDTLEQGLTCLDATSQVYEVASVYLNQAFSAPPTLNFKSLVSTIKTTLRTHEDHLWLLQTDPSYFRRNAANFISGGIGENFSKPHQYVSVANKIMQDVVCCWSWTWILEEAEKLAAMYEIISNDSSPEQSLRRKFQQLLGAFEVFLCDQFSLRREYAKGVLPLRPGFLDSYKVDYTQDEHVAFFSQDRKNGSETIHELFSQDRLDFCLTWLVDEDVEAEISPSSESRWVPTTSTLFAMLNDHLRRSPQHGSKKDIARLDEILYTWFSDMSTVHQILTLIKLNRPLVAKLEMKDIKDTQEGRGWRYLRSRFLEIIAPIKCLLHEDGQLTLEKELPKGGLHKIESEQKLSRYLQAALKLPDPAETNYSHAWLEKDAAQRAAISDFWNVMRERHQYVAKQLQIDREDYEADLKSLSADNEPEYIAQLQRERQAILEIVQKRELEKKARKMRDDQALPIQTEWGTTSLTKIDVPLTKLKIKSRVSTDEVREDTQAPSPSQSIASTKNPKVGVSKSALEIFHSLFPGLSPEDRPKSVRWTAFVKAMTEENVGFVVSHTGGGSAYLFEPSENSRWAGQGAITFHKPHPEVTIDPTVLQSMGKRLWKWFGWNKDTFELREKAVGL